LKMLIPQKYLSVEIAEYLRRKLYNETEFLDILRFISKNLIEKHERIETSRKNLKDEI
jgi:hypothetical protein